MTERDQIAELIQQLGLVRAELRRCEVQRDDTAATLRRVQAELHQALSGREREYHRAEEALEQLRAVKP
jgi:hypothetical protein